MSRVGIVVIGRNEGDRLRSSLTSVNRLDVPVVYVDSDSRDGSAELARSIGVTVLELDATKPMSAARARNAGFDRLMDDHPALEFVQFLDGDCDLFPGWIDRGVEILCTRSDVGIVCGRVVERHPEASIYNLMCALEWQQEPGEVVACGGRFMARTSAFKAIGGFRDDVMAAEDDELCIRMRRHGYKIYAVVDDMALHDVALTRFSQWWNRARRAGMAYSQVHALYGNEPEQYFKRNLRSTWFWGAAVPLASLAVSIPTRGFGLLGLTGYPLLAAKIYRAQRKRGRTPKEAAVVATLTVAAKWPELMGIVHFHYRTRVQRRSLSLIEYK
jgi:GT2 family glycosyltransferase